MSLTQKMHFLLDVFQMTTIVLVSVINPYHINGLQVFWDTLKSETKKNTISLVELLAARYILKYHIYAN